MNRDPVLDAQRSARVCLDRDAKRAASAGKTGSIAMFALAVSLEDDNRSSP